MITADVCEHLAAAHTKGREGVGFSPNPGSTLNPEPKAVDPKVLFHSCLQEDSKP